MMIGLRSWVKRCSGLARDERGGPLAEFALIVPFLILLTFGAFEFARLLYIQNSITKSVQDAGRFLSRNPALLLENSCPPSGSAWTSAETAARQIAATGDRLSGGSLIYYDFDPVTNTSQMSISVTCESITQDGETLDSPLAGGIPIVVVTASVPITDIGFFQFIGRSSITLTAEHREMAVGL